MRPGAADTPTCSSVDMVTQHITYVLSVDLSISVVEAGVGSPSDVKNGPDNVLHGIAEEVRIHPDIPARLLCEHGFQSIFSAVNCKITPIRPIDEKSS